MPSSFFLKDYKVVATLNNYYPLIATGYSKNNIIESGNLTIGKVFMDLIKTFQGNILKRFIASVFYSFYSRMVYYFSRKNISAYIAYSEGVKDIYVKNGFNNKRIYVIPSPTNLEIFPNKIARDKKTVLYVGGPYEAKGFYDLLNASELVKDKDIKFNFVGIRYIPKEVKRYNSNVDFIKPVSQKELARYYSSSSVLVHPSQWPEPFSRVWIEAMAYRVPLISSDNPVAKKELGKAAIFYKRGNSLELANKIDSFFKGEIKPNLIALDSLRKKFLNNNSAAKVIRLYKSLK